MKKTWFPQLIAAFILAAVAGLYLVPQTLSAEEMNQIVGACDCSSETMVFCEAKKKDNNCYEIPGLEKYICVEQNPKTGICKDYNRVCTNKDCKQPQNDRKCKK